MQHETIRVFCRIEFTEEKQKKEAHPSTQKIL